LVHESQLRLFHRRPDEDLSQINENSVASFLFPSSSGPAVAANQVPVQREVIVPENQNLLEEGEGPADAAPENADNNQVPDNNQIAEPGQVADNPEEDSIQQPEQRAESSLAEMVNKNFEADLAVAMAKAKQKRIQQKINKAVDKPVEQPVEQPTRKSERLAAKTVTFVLPKHRED
jgi:hypothetical protein